MIISETPLRISLLGGGTDFPEYFKKYGGACISATIDKYIYCIVKKRFDDEIWINYSIKEKVTKVKHIKHDLVREAMNLVGIEKGLEITFMSDIPSEGSGLGSSSAVLVGLLNALHTYQNDPATPTQLADEACYIELEILKKPIGVQDQFAVAFGGFNLFEMQESVSVTEIPITDIDDYLMLFYTGVTRKAEKVLSTMKMDKELLDKTKALAYAKYNTLTDPIILGDMLSRHWALKNELNPSSVIELISENYLKALNAGSYGGKIVGAGGGGFLLLVVPPEKQKEVRHAVGLREMPFKMVNHGSRIIFNINE